VSDFKLAVKKGASGDPVRVIAYDIEGELSTDPLAKVFKGPTDSNPAEHTLDAEGDGTYSHAFKDPHDKLRFVKAFLEFEGDETIERKEPVPDV